MFMELSICASWELSYHILAYVENELLRSCDGSNEMDPPLSSAASMSQNGGGIFDNSAVRLTHVPRLEVPCLLVA
jgi:hypothetical protein